jgi:adenylate cyclase
MSIVHLLGPDRIGLSYQFLSKSLENLRQNPQAQVVVMDPVTLREYRLDVVFEGLRREGPTFERMGAQLAAVASQTGMEGVFRLNGLVECHVRAWAPAGATDLDDGIEPLPDPIEQLDRVAASIQSATDLDTLLEKTFDALEAHLDQRHAFLLLTDPAEQHLYAIASRGFGDSGVGTEIAFGEGPYGTCAARRIPIRDNNLRRARVMLDAVATGTGRGARHAPLPGLRDAESSLALPVLAGDRCLGVLCFQSPRPGAFSADTERLLMLVARHLGAMISLLRIPENALVQLSSRRGPVGSRALVTRVRYFESDGSVFVDDAYLIKGVAGRVLWRVLSTYVEEHRDEFSNREIRLDAQVGLPALNDNLEARLIALRRRLEERCTPLRIERIERGRFRLEVDRELILERRD